MKLTEDQIAALKEKHGEITVVATVEGDCAFRLPKRAEYSRYQEFLFREATRHKAPEMLVRDCVVAPSKEEFDALLERRPGVATTCIGPVLTLAGVDTDAETKNY